MIKKLTEYKSDSYSLFLFAINSPFTKEKYVPRLNKFFEYINLRGSIQEKCSTFVKNANDQPPWALGSVIKYLQMSKDRVEKKEITAATAMNAVKTIKLFCEMNDILLPWKRITRGFPKARRYADDRAPTSEEILKIVNYPDRRIRPIVSTMVSSGIRLGAWNFLKWKHIIPLIKEGISHNIRVGSNPTRTAARSLAVKYRMFDEMYEEEKCGFNINEDEIAQSVLPYIISMQDIYSRIYLERNY